MDGGPSAAPIVLEVPASVDPTTPLAPEALGATVRRMRLARELTLVRLADAAGLSHPFLSQIERGRARPSMASLERIARALGSSVVELLAPGSERPQLVESHVLRADHGVTGPYGLGTARLLGPELLTFVPMECRGDNVQAGAHHVHEEDEFLTVLDGLLLLELAADVHALSPGDSATIASGTPHRWRSPDGTPYRLLVVKEGAGIARMRDDLRHSAEALEEWRP